MAKANLKTNAMRVLETNKIPYEVYTYESDGDFDGRSVARCPSLPLGAVGG